MEVTPELLKKYSKGDCSAKEIEAVEGWLNFKDDIIEDEGVFPNDMESRIWTRIEETKKELPREIKRKPTNYKIWSVAASILLLISVTTYVFIFNKDIKYSTSVGELKEIELADGTKITLNAASILIIDENFNATDRSVTLNGEAFFEVAKDSLHPFTITTQKTVTKVLGTQFNLSAYKNETNIVTLNEGKILFYKKGFSEETGVVLKPNEQIVLQDELLVKSTVNSQKYCSWLLHDFIFVNESMQSIASKMERRYGVNIHIEKENVKKELFRGTYKNPTLISLLEDLSFVLNFKYKQDGNNITIY